MDKSNFLQPDIELYPNYFEVGIKDFITKEVFYFEVDSRKDDRVALLDFLLTYTGYWITFNGVHYDNVVLAYFMKNHKRMMQLKPLEFVRELKEFSNLVIDDNYEKIKWYKWYKHKWIDIDLFLYWAKSLRISKKISLKSLGIQLNHDRVQELPYPHNQHLTDEEKDNVRDYNLNNDLVILDVLCTRMQEDIKLRKYIHKEYGLSCWSMDAPKICSEYLLQKFCEKTWEEHEGEYQTFEEYKRETRSSRYIPKPDWKLGTYLPHINFKTKYFQDLFEEIKASGSEFNKEFLFEKNDTRVVVSMGIGGIHILNVNEKYYSTKDSLIIDQDVASLYPTLLDVYKFIRPELTIVLNEYLELKKDRISAKREGNKIKDTFLKLCLNGFTGIVDQETSWLYSPEHMIALRVFGQLIQLRVLEELTEAGIRVISNNTDGTTAIIPLGKIQEYHEINNKISREFKIDWEYCVIDKIIYTNVNNYIGFISKEYMVDSEGNEINVKEKPKVKKKGFYKHGNEIPLGDSVNEQAVSKALEFYWRDNIPVEEVLSNPDKYDIHIYDYCKSNRISKDYEVFYLNDKVQNLNRYYFQRKGAYLLKRKKNKAKNTFEHVNVGEGVALFNTYEQKSFQEYNVNYQHYIKKAATIIAEINNKQLVLL
jgi:hypothetical protein